jgi:hypothetical protein
MHLRRDQAGMEFVPRLGGPAMTVRQSFRPRVGPLEGRALLSALIAQTEPNNAPATADVIRLDPADSSADVTGQARGKDRDFFRIRPVAAGTLTLTAQASGRPVLVDVFNARSGRRVWSELLHDASRGTTLDVQAGTPLLVRFRGAAARGLSSYGLHVGLTPASASPGPSAPAPGGGIPTGSQVTPIAPGTIVLDNDGRAVIAGSVAPGEVDVYTFTAPDGGRVSLMPARRIPVRIDAMDASGRTLLTMYGDVPNFISSFHVDAGSTYTLQVSRKPDATAGAVDYRISLGLQAV